jgi:hypothetical protein
MRVNIYKNKKVADIYLEETAFSGVKKIAEKVCRDIELVAEAKPVLRTNPNVAADLIIVGTIGKSAVLEQMAQQQKLDLSAIYNKREVYTFQVVNQPIPMVERALVIAGSDKRGTIYGLFHISELIGVSPLVNWCDVIPKKQNEILIMDQDNVVSREPSVKFRGFFINDEWPAFGNWCMKNFGGFNAKAYEQVFELLLRLKGNYLWPAMWSARFEDDGPGLLNAELADEYGVVMGMSHHEPCLRQGEEYKYLRGKDSVYGDAWNFRTNREGIIRFWEDGLKRSGKFENVITVGMRGEADTAILGKKATLADNIELLRDVLKTQRKLIQDNVKEDLSRIPRMIALYKEVEEFFYGTKEVKGLMGCEELEDVILMLCDDNFGNLRTLPTEEMRKHKGGYGMYYHFDYHGWPISYEWINSSYLPKIWEQMTMAYDFSIRDLWVVNVGDVCTQEFPLSFFLDLAYDFDRWGTAAVNHTEKYTRLWVKRQFQAIFDESEQEKVVTILNGYTKIVHKRRPEAMNANIYHPVNDKETQRTLDEIKTLLTMADVLYQKVSPKDLPAYFSLVYYPAVGTLNLYRLQLLAGLNHYFAKLGAMIANTYAKSMVECFERDRRLIEEYHTIDNGKFFGMGMSEHIGFIHWNEDECQNPVVMQVFPANKPRVMIMVDGTDQHSEGSSWHKNRLYLMDFLEPDICEASISLYNISDLKADYKIINNVEWLTCTLVDGILEGADHSMKRIGITIDRNKMAEEEEGEILIQIPSGECVIIIPAKKKETTNWAANTFIMERDYISIEAEHYTACKKGRNESGFLCMEGYGKTKSAMKVYPTTAYFTAGVDAPYLEYQFVVNEEGNYEAELYMQPSNPVSTDNELLYAVSCNEEEANVYNAIQPGQKVGDLQLTWAEGVLNNIRRKVHPVVCKAGINKLRIYAVTPGFVLEKLVIYQEGNKPNERYLGPVETYYVGRNKGCL